MSTETNQTQKKQLFILLSLVFGIAVIAVNIYLGFTRYNAYVAIGVCAFLHTVFRVSKRFFKTQQTTEPSTTISDNGSSDNVDEAQDDNYGFVNFIAIYCMMLVVSLIWYFIGYGIQWLVL